MNDLFNENGCLSDYALHCLISESPELTPLNRLEISEHLSFCDLCLERYMRALESTALKQPPKPQTAPIKKRIAARATKLFIGRYATAAAAACFAIIFTVFGAMGPFKAKSDRTFTAYCSSVIAANEKKAAIAKQTQENLQSIWDFFNPDSNNSEGDSDDA